MIPYARQQINRDDIDEVVEVLQSDFLTQGPLIERFEQVLINYTGAAHAVAVNSATSALHLACLALGLSEGDWLWTSPISFVASANCALYCGAQVDFVDIDATTGNLSLAALEAKLAAAEKAGQLPKILIPVHFAGQPCDMLAIHCLARRYGFKIIEDAAHALGARYHNHPVGSSEFSDITVFSFHPVKSITSGEGGMAMTNNAELADSMRRLRNHGITRDPSKMTLPADGRWSYQQIDLGFNYRLSDIHAALGLSQMRQLDEFISQRQQIAERYDQALEHLPLKVLPATPEQSSAHHLYVIQLLDEAAMNRQQLYEHLLQNNIAANVHYSPIYRQPYYQRMGFDQAEFPQAEDYYQRALSLPLFPALSPLDQGRVIAALEAALR